MKIGIVVSEWYWDEITAPMARLAERTANEAKVETVTVSVPGSFDIPLGVQRLLQREDIQGVVALGAIVQGETGHDEVIAQAIANALQQLMLRSGKPVMLGVTGPKMTHEQAKARVSLAAEYMRACIKMVGHG